MRYPGDFFSQNGDSWMIFQRGLDALREGFSIDGQRTTRRNRRRIRTAQQQRTQTAQFVFQQTGCASRQIGAERIAAHQFCKTICCVGGCCFAWTHFIKGHIDAALGSLPRGFCSGETPSDYMQV
jgi:hypothetical protein